MEIGTLLLNERSNSESTMGRFQKAILEPPSFNRKLQRVSKKLKTYFAEYYPLFCGFQ
jgi:hypothetical protein